MDGPSISSKITPNIPYRPYHFANHLQAFHLKWPREFIPLLQSAAAEIGGQRLFAVSPSEDSTAPSNAEEKTSPVNFSINPNAPFLGVGVTKDPTLVQLREALFTLTPTNQEDFDSKVLAKGLLKYIVFPLVAYRAALSEFPTLKPLDDEYTPNDLQMYYECLSWVRVSTVIRLALKDEQRGHVIKAVLNEASQVLENISEDTETLTIDEAHAIGAYLYEIVNADSLIPEEKLEAALSLVSNEAIYGENALKLTFDDGYQKHKTNIRDLLRTANKLPGGLLETTTEEVELEKAAARANTPEELAALLGRAIDLSGLDLVPMDATPSATVGDWSRKLLNPDSGEAFFDLSSHDRENLVLLVDQALETFSSLMNEPGLMALLEDQGYLEDETTFEFNVENKRSTYFYLSMIPQIPTLCDNPDRFARNIHDLPLIVDFMRQVIDQSQNLLMAPEASTRKSILNQISTAVGEIKTQEDSIERRLRPEIRELARALGGVDKFNIGDLATALGFYHERPQPRPEKDTIIERPRNGQEWWLFIFRGGHMGRFTHLHNDQALLTELITFIETGLPLHEIIHVHTAECFEPRNPQIYASATWKFWEDLSSNNPSWKFSQLRSDLANPLVAPQLIVFLPDSKTHAAILEEVCLSYAHNGAFFDFLSLQAEADRGATLMENGHRVPASHLLPEGVQRVLDAQNRFWEGLKKLSQNEPVMEKYPQLRLALQRALESYASTQPQA